MTLPSAAAETAVETDPSALAPSAIAGRSLGRIAYERLRRDKIAFASAVVIVLLVAVAVFAPQFASLIGNDPYTPHTDLIDPNLQIPKSGFGAIGSHHLLGVDVPLGRDLLARIMYGARVSLGIAGASTLLAITIGVVLGMVSGYFGGWVDSLIARTMDIMLAFPLLLFAISLSGVLGYSSFGLHGNTLRIVLLIFIIGFFSWPYIGRIVRGQTIALREREFVDAARSLGAGPGRILFREILPNLMAPILVYTTLLIPTNILFEAALSYLGVGIRAPMPSWGEMINEAIPVFEVDPTFMIVPGTAIFVTVFAFNLFGDGLRDAFDPKGSR